MSNTEITTENENTPQRALLRALANVSAGEIEELLVLGLTPEGDLLINASDMTNQAALWLLELAKIHVMYEDGDEEDE